MWLTIKDLDQEQVARMRSTYGMGDAEIERYANGAKANLSADEIRTSIGFNPLAVKPSRRGKRFVMDNRKRLRKSKHKK